MSACPAASQTAFWASKSCANDGDGGGGGDGSSSCRFLISAILLIDKGNCRFLIGAILLIDNVARAVACFVVGKMATWRSHCWLIRARPRGREQRWGHRSTGCHLSVRALNFLFGQFIQSSSNLFQKLQTRTLKNAAKISKILTTSEF
jgi:hypothetical protein